MKGTRMAGQFFGIILFVGVLAVLGAGCTKSVPDAYSDFLTDLDILARFEVCFDDVREGHAGSYTIGELRTLQKDLQEGYRIEDEQAARTTDLFCEAAECLIAALENEDPDGAVEDLEWAEAVYRDAWHFSEYVRRGSGEE